MTMKQENKTESSTTLELPTSYTPSAVETKWYSYYLKNNLFTPNLQSAKPSYCIVMPPPNVTGVLHMGHALVNTLQDILIRWKKMSGFETLWVPGLDHAGIATQTVVERHLLRTTGKRRVDFTRDEFLAHVWKWKEESGSSIISQLKTLGCACDWSRLAFSMDETRSKSVRRAFKLLFDQGLIYRGNYLVNWDPVTGTALADDEVEYEERQGSLWHFRYPVPEIGHIDIATTRPETMLGDTAVAVHPNDERYTHLIGKQILHPLTNRSIPIVADPFVDPTFGTGAVKITPAHDHNDYALALRHNLPMLSIMNKDGTINEEGGEFKGLSMQEARARIVELLRHKGVLLKEVPHILRVGLSYRSKAILEPHLSQQWFVKLSSFSERLREVVDSKQVDLLPTHWKATYFHWIDNLRDWCISRQLWWGHRIPIWYSKENPEIVICYDGEGAPPEVEKNPDMWVQDPDVLDTWFSSALWPFSTLGWPDKGEEFRRFYPNSTLVTGHDILFFWVAKMMMMGEALLQTPPFKETFLHGLIYGKSYWRENVGGGITYASADEQKNYDLGAKVPPEVKSKWEKMSKSKGNIIDPLEIITEYGADACRMALAASATEARQIDLDRRRFEEFKNFANKVWNGARFVLMNTQELEHTYSSKLGIEDSWILSRLQKTISSINNSLQKYAFDKAATNAYDFFWNEFCAFYVEMSKPALFGKKSLAEKGLKQRVALYVLINAIRLLHPFAPFISDELFRCVKIQLPKESLQHPQWMQEAFQALQADVCLLAPFPETNPLLLDEESEYTFERFQKLLLAIRGIRGEMKIPPQTTTDLFIVQKKEHQHQEGRISTTQLVEALRTPLTALARVGRLEFIDKVADIGPAAQAPFEESILIIPIPKELLSKEKERVEKEVEKSRKGLEKMQKTVEQMQNSSSVPPQVLSKNIESLQQLQSAVRLLETQLEKLR